MNQMCLFYIRNTKIPLIPKCQLNVAHMELIESLIWSKAVFWSMAEMCLDMLIRAAFSVPKTSTVSPIK